MARSLSIARTMPKPDLCSTVHESLGGGALIPAANGLFLAHVVNGAITIDPTGNADIGRVLAMRTLTGSRVLIGAAKGLFVAVPSLGAQVEPPRPGW
jgi:hypothetical protein